MVGVAKKGGRKMELTASWRLVVVTTFCREAAKVAVSKNEFVLVNFVVVLFVLGSVTTM